MRVAWIATDWRRIRGRNGKTFTTGIGTGFEDGLSESQDRGASGSESGCQWEW